MTKLPLTLACWDYDRTRPLIDGQIQPEGIDLRIEVLRPRDMFPRMLANQEFDCCELSMASLASLIGRDACPFVALPVPLSKLFRHSCIYIRPGAGISTPADLVGKRVGTTQYGSTAAVFMRGVLHDDFQIEARDMRWFMGGLDAPTQEPLIPLNLPPEIQLEYLHTGQTLEAMLESGDLDALFSIYLPKLFLRKSPHIARLFPDYRQVEEQWQRRTGIFPIMHAVALRKDVHEAHPWVAASLYEAFRRARDIALDALYDTDALRVALPWLIHHVEEARAVFGEDYWAYGFEANRATAAALGRYVHEQGLSPRAVTAEEIFLPLD
jgi:4,5-dihydroxyphthalate decarboxylase